MDNYASLRQQIADMQARQSMDRFAPQGSPYDHTESFSNSMNPNDAFGNTSESVLSAFYNAPSAIPRLMESFPDYQREPGYYSDPINDYTGATEYNEYFQPETPWERLISGGAETVLDPLNAVGAPYAGYKGLMKGLNWGLTDNAMAEKFLTDQFGNRKYAIGGADAITPETIIRKTRENEGYSVSPKTTDIPDEGYMVGQYGNTDPLRHAEYTDPTPQQINDFLKANSDVLEDPNKYVGTWLDSDTGLTHLDIARKHDDMIPAMDDALSRDEIAIWDAAKAEELRHERYKPFDLLDERIDPRYDGRRIGTQDRLNEIDIEKIRVHDDKPPIYLPDYEGHPIITSMADISDGNAYTIGLNNTRYDTPQQLFAGQEYMMNNEGRLWETGVDPANDLMAKARAAYDRTGKQPLFAPWQMAPSSADYSHHPVEAMLNYMRNNANKRNMAYADSRLKKLIPDWKGVADPESIAQYRNVGDGNVRKEILSILDRDLRDRQGLTKGEARLSIADPSQINKRDGSLKNIGLFDLDQGISMHDLHPTYDYTVHGKGLGQVDRPMVATQLLRDTPMDRPIKDFLNPTQEDLRSLQMNAKTGDLTYEQLRYLGY